MIVPSFDLDAVELGSVVVVVAVVVAAVELDLVVAAVELIVVEFVNAMQMDDEPVVLADVVFAL